MIFVIAISLAIGDVGGRAEYRLTEGTILSRFRQLLGNGPESVLKIFPMF